MALSSLRGATVDWRLFEVLLVYVCVHACVCERKKHGSWLFLSVSD